MKVTALLPDDLITEVRRYGGQATLTDSLALALREWVALRRIKELNGRVSGQPLRFRAGFTAAGARALSRRRRAW